MDIHRLHNQINSASQRTKNHFVDEINDTQHSIKKSVDSYSQYVNNEIAIAESQSKAIVENARNHLTAIDEESSDFVQISDNNYLESAEFSANLTNSAELEITTLLQSDPIPTKIDRLLANFVLSSPEVSTIINEKPDAVSMGLRPSQLQ